MPTTKTRCLILLLALLGACDQAPAPESAAPTRAPGAAASVLPGASAPAPTGTAPGYQSGPATDGDQARCEQACSKLSACGVAFGPSCASDCMLQPVFRGCVRSAAPECNALAMCAFQAGSAAFCGGSGGVPAGTQSCGTVALCEGMCTVANQPASCACACAATLSPAGAIKLLINNQCAQTKCASACRPGGSGPECISCFQTSCASESAQCAADTTSGLPAVSPPAGAIPPAGGGSPPAGTVPQPGPAAVAPAATLDPQLVGVWPLDSVHVIFDGSAVPDIAQSNAVAAELGPQQLTLGSDGSYLLGQAQGTWAVAPFTAADRALWGTGGLGPDGYARKLVLTRNDGKVNEGPINDPAPPGTAPWGIKFGFRFVDPQPGRVEMNFRRHTTTAPTGVKR